MIDGYWEVPECERAKLTREEVERFADIELMREGVIRAGTLDLVDEPEMPEPDDEVFVARVGYHHAEVAFRSTEEALASFEGALGKVTSKSYGTYPGTFSIKFVDQFDNNTDPNKVVERVPVYSESRRSEMAAAIEQAAEARAENSRRRSEHQRLLTAQEKALRGMWKDWHERCGEAVHYQKIIDTFGEYTKMAAGDRAIARGFLMKTFDMEDVTNAFDWAGLDGEAAGVAEGTANV